MKKIFSSVILSLIILVLPFACLSSSDTPSPASASPASFRLDIKHLPVAYIKKVDTPPEIDGVIDELYTKNGKPLVFKFLNGSSTTPVYTTKAWILRDASNLYIAVWCKTKDPDRIPASRKQRDNSVWQDEAIEIFIDPLNTRWELYYHIMINSLNTTQDSRNRADISWDPDLTVKCGKEKGKAWIMEVKIPFKELGVDPKTMKKIWSFNITRTAYDVDNTDSIEELAWSPVGDDYVHVPELFGYLVFTGKK